jgi:hypothetical protein
MVGKFYKWGINRIIGNTGKNGARGMVVWVEFVVRVVLGWMIDDLVIADG